MTASIRIDPETGQKHFNTRAAKATDKISGKGYSVIEEESLKTLPPPPPGAVFNAATVLDFGDLMILGMAFPNVLGVVLLAGPLKKELATYLARLKSGEFERYT